MISISDCDNPNVVTMKDALERSSTSVKFEGHYYMLIQKGNSQCTNFSCDSGYAPVINLNSRTIRAINYNARVEIIDLSINVHYDR